MINLLRLGSSNDVFAGVPEDLRAGAVAARILGSAAGETVETVSRVIWPGPELPDLLDRWLDRYRADVVALKINWFWFAHESVPLKLERRYGSLGRAAGSAGQRAAGVPWLARGRFFGLANRLALQTIGGETYFTPEDVLARMGACIRRILVREHVVVVVLGPGGNQQHRGLPRGALARYEDKWRLVDARMADLCRDLSIPYIARDRPRARDEFHRRLGKDGFHMGPEGQRLAGTEEGEALAAAWRAARGERSASFSLT